MGDIMGQIIIGISGPIGSGKTKLSNILAEKWGHVHLSFGKLIENILREEGVEITRESLQDKGEQIIKDIGYRGIVDLLFEKYKIDKISNYVIDGIRHVEVCLYFKELFGDSFKLIFVEAPENIRLERIKNRLTKDVIRSINELRSFESREIEKGIIDFKKYADLIIQNVMSETYLENKLERFLKNL